MEVRESFHLLITTYDNIPEKLIKCLFSRPPNLASHACSTVICLAGLFSLLH